MYISAVKALTALVVVSLTLTITTFIRSEEHIKATLQHAGTVGTRGPGYGGTSLSNITLNTDEPKTFVLDTAASYAYAANQRVRASHSESVYVEGTVVSYTASTRRLVVELDIIIGEMDTSYANWTLGLIGMPGIGYAAVSYSTVLMDNSGDDKVFVLEPLGHYDFTPVQYIRCLETSVYNWMDGYVVSYNKTSRVLVVMSVNATTTGTYSNWSIHLAGEQNVQGAHGVTGSGYGGTSTTSHTIGLGSMVFSVTSNASLAYAVGLRVRVANSETNYVEGVITAFSTPLLTLAVDTTSGSGTFTSWSVGIAGNVGLTGANGLTYTTTSTTSITIGMGSKAFTIATTSAYGVGLRIRCANSLSNYVEGPVASYTHPTLTLTVDHTAGSGTFTSWTCGLAGDVGAAGPPGNPGNDGSDGNDGADGTDGDDGLTYTAASTTSITIGTGSKAFTVATLSAYAVGLRVRCANSISNYVEGPVASYAHPTLTLTVDHTAGSGTFASWTCGLAGDVGATGNNGNDGNDGANGDNGLTYTAASTTSITIGTGSKAFTVATTSAYAIGLRVRCANSASAYVEGPVASYSHPTLTLTVDYTVGSGTFASWTCGLAGDVGAAGSAGGTGPTGPAGSGYGGTSTTSNAIGLGSKTYTLNAATYAYVVGSRVRAFNSAGNYMVGDVTSYSSTTLIFTADVAIGSGTYTSWTFTLAGESIVSGSVEYTVAGSYTYTIPTGTKWLRAIFCGGGGGAGAGNSAANYGGGGGGGGAMCRFETIVVESDTTVSVTVAAGGLGGATAAADGAAGGTTTIALGTRSMPAYGGGGGAGVSSTSQSGGGGGSAGSGAAGGSATTDASGSAGGSGTAGQTFLPFSVAGLAGGSGTAADGAAGLAQGSDHSNSLYLRGGGGGAGATALVATFGTNGGRGEGGYAGGAAGSGSTSKGPGGGGGGSGLGVGGAGGGSAVGPTAGTRGSGGGGGNGGTGATWSAGAAGGAGYVFIQPF